MWTLLLGAALAGDCQEIGFNDILAVEAPAVIVLGERHGTQPDLARATRLMRNLHERAPVTLALEAVHEDYQAQLDSFAEGQIEIDAVEAALSWEESWGFAFAPYARLVTAATAGVHVLAAGTTLGKAPEDARYPIPSGYMTVLRDAMSGHEMPLDMEERFVRSMAWRDYKIASLATGPWDQTGYLVIVTGRGHVEGGKGVAWQAEQSVDVPVKSFVLAWGKEPPCYPGDSVWKPGLFERRK
ncbi:MAG: ChaN family lipoprotein [Proteobacteria bacterium]|nr:ChaN family lipoprotein [Pseudomonadota bacterium]